MKSEILFGFVFGVVVWWLSAHLSAFAFSMILLAYVGIGVIVMIFALDAQSRLGENIENLARNIYAKENSGKILSDNAVKTLVYVSTIYGIVNWPRIFAGVVCALATGRYQD